MRTGQKNKTRRVGPSTTSTLLVNADGRILGFISWQRAMTMVVEGSAYIIEEATEVVNGVERPKMVRSPSVSFPMPKTICLKKYVYVPYAAFLESRNDTATRRAILTRDKWRCAYCGEKANTIDHILPVSRRGKTTWENCVAACARCNNKKADKTPEEAGMPLLWEPRQADDWIADMQQRVWDQMS